MDIYNATNVFLKVGFTDINKFYIFLAIGIILVIVSRALPEMRVSKIAGNVICAIMAFFVLLGCVYLSANIGSIYIQPQWYEDTTNHPIGTDFHNSTVDHFYNGSQIEIIPQNNFATSTIVLVLLIGSFLNMLELILSLYQMREETLDVEAKS